MLGFKLKCYMSLLGFKIKCYTFLLGFKPKCYIFLFTSSIVFLKQKIHVPLLLAFMMLE